MKRFFLLWTCISIFSSYTVLAQYDDLIQKTESPYFFIKNEGSAVEQFPLLSTQVRVEVVGPIADVLVEQTYRNNGSVPIEATYVFPASTRAAVYDLEMIIGERRIKAEIKEKEEARLKYEEAKQEGKRASLLEQERPNVFQMNVANIMPGDLIKVVLRYNEFIIPEKQQYAFVFPTVVGPRYVSSRNPGVHESFAANPYLSNGQDVPYSFDIQIALSPGVPITTINSPSHQIDINFENLNKASARLSAQEKKGGNRDFILQYTLSGDGISSGTILYEHGDENFFLTTIEPPKLKPETQILPREYLFVVDVSGSMYGFPIETTKQLMKDLISKLRSNDLFNLILFAGDNTILSPVSLPANEQYLQLAFEAIDHLQGSGSTEIIPALKRIFSIPKINKDLSRSIVVVTDGYVSVEPEVFEMISEHIGDGNVFAFGIGGGVNRFLIEGIAHAGRGEAFVVTKPEMASEAASKFRNYVEHPIMTNITYRFSGFDAYDVIPAAIPDLMAERPLYIFGKYRGKANGSLVLNGRQAGKDFEERID
ncbi:MAG: VWA domain-containing protein, partial [Saprospiraceae bacterium]|nr:VWA domain-containing protein [Saprospiraceae bacterium]